jgi:hypothetical protein
VPHPPQRPIRDREAESDVQISLILGQSVDRQRHGTEDVEVDVILRRDVLRTLRGQQRIELPNETPLDGFVPCGRGEIQRAIPRHRFLIDDKRRSTDLEPERSREIVLGHSSADVLRPSVRRPVSKHVVRLLGGARRGSASGVDQQRDGTQ